MKFISIGAFLAALSVIFGAFGAHGLKGKITPDLLEIYETASHYFILHAIAVMLYGFFIHATKRQGKPWPAQLFLAGIAIFCGSLYLIVLTKVRTFGMITPLGGLSFILAWIGFGLHARKA